MTNHDSVIEVKELHKHFPILRGFLRRVVGQVKAGDNVSFAVNRGETLALVGVFYVRSSQVLAVFSSALTATRRPLT